MHRCEDCQHSGFLWMPGTVKGLLGNGIFFALQTTDYLQITSLFEIYYKVRVNSLKWLGY